MLKLLDNTYKAAIITVLQEVKVSTQETNRKMESLSIEIEYIKNNQIWGLAPWPSG